MPGGNVAVTDGVANSGLLRWYSAAPRCSSSASRSAAFVTVTSAATQQRDHARKSSSGTACTSVRGRDHRCRHAHQAIAGGAPYVALYNAGIWYCWRAPARSVGQTVLLLWKGKSAMTCASECRFVWYGPLRVPCRHDRILPSPRAVMFNNKTLPNVQVAEISTFPGLCQ